MARGPLADDLGEGFGGDAGAGVVERVVEGAAAVEADEAVDAGAREEEEIDGVAGAVEAVADLVVDGVAASLAGLPAAGIAGDGDAGVSRIVVHRWMSSGMMSLAMAGDWRRKGSMAPPPTKGSK